METIKSGSFIFIRSLSASYLLLPYESSGEHSEVSFLGTSELSESPYTFTELKNTNCFTPFLFARSATLRHRSLFTLKYSFSLIFFD